jgi:hypothetical protein
VVAGGGKPPPECRLSAAVAADHDIFQHGHVLEQADVLKGPGHAPFGDLVGLEAVDRFGRPFSGGRDQDIALGGVIDAR